MKSVIKWSLLSIGVVSLAVIFYFGNQKMQAESYQQGQEALAMDKIMKEKEAKRIEAEINKYKPNGNPRTVVDDLNYYKALNQRPVVISTLGSSVTYGAGTSDLSYSWGSRLQSYLNNNGFPATSVKNNGFSGYTSSSILGEKKVEAVIDQKPDLIIFETCMINDHSQSVPMDVVKKNISDVVDKLTKALPTSKIIVMSSNPRKDDKKNNLGLTMADYASAEKDFAQQKGWYYIDVYGAFKEKAIDLSKVINSDGIHPNDDGYKEWFEIMKAEFAKVK